MVESNPKAEFRLGADCTINAVPWLASCSRYQSRDENARILELVCTSITTWDRHSVSEPSCKLNQQEEPSERRLFQLDPLWHSVRMLNHCERDWLQS